MALEYNPALEPCPICGKKAYVMHSVVDGFSFGWDAERPYLKLEDGISLGWFTGCSSKRSKEDAHGFTWDDEIEWPSFRLNKQDAIDSWNVWVGKWKGRHNGNHQHNSEEK